jgi:hypothetical protein
MTVPLDVTGGFVVYEGPSLLDGSPIAAVITRHSLNTKTGDMAQAWILRADRDVQSAIADGSDRAICGDCRHRSGGSLGRSCYVVTWLGPLKVWKTYARGGYPRLTPREGAAAIYGRVVRLAAYGDPAAVPTTIWSELLSGVSGWTGYTHQWRTCDQRLRGILMASVDTPREAADAAALGWRTFRVRTLDEPLGDAEIVCPASEEAGHRLTCADCKLCVGTARAGARSVAIFVHGQRARWFQRSA